MMLRGTCRVKTVEGNSYEYDVTLKELRLTLKEIKKTHTGPKPSSWTKPMATLLIRNALDCMNDPESVSTITINSKRSFINASF